MNAMRPRQRVDFFRQPPERAASGQAEPASSVAAVWSRALFLDP